MGNNVMGVIGVEVTDILLYLSKILYHLEKRTLIVDLSSHKELISSIANRMDLPVFHYNGIDISNILDESLNYDHVIIYYGFSYNDSLKDCNRIIFVSDMSSKHITAISRIYKELLCNNSCIEKSLLFIHLFDIKIKIEHIIEVIDQKIDLSKVDCIYADLEDMRLSIMNQYNKEITFKKLSPSFKHFLLEMVKKIEPSCNTKQLQLAYKKAERGYI